MIAFGMTTLQTHMDMVATELVRLYEIEFGGKLNGRYRIALKLVRKIAARRRLYDDDVRSLKRAMFERGYVLIDMDGFFVVLSSNTFVNYRRANEESVQ